MTVGLPQSLFSDQFYSLGTYFWLYFLYSLHNSTRCQHFTIATAVFLPW